jgi:hypothetical protein
VRADSEKQGEPQVPEFNPSYDRSIPLAYVNESGLQLYKKWFETDPAISRNLAFFDEALKGGRLTKPDGKAPGSFIMF